MKTFRFIISIFLLVLSFDLAAQNSPAPRKLIEFVITPDAADWNYALGQKASVQVTVLKYGVPLKGATLQYEAGPEMLVPDQKGTLALPNGQGRIEVGSSRQPGFRQLVVRTEHEGQTYSDGVKLAFAPGQIKPTVPLPADFKQFWQKAREESVKLPMDVMLTPLPQYTTAKVDVFLVNLQNYKKGQRLYGYLCKPKGEGKYPVLFSPPGAGVKSMLPFTAYAEQGFISLSIEIHGISPLLDNETYRNISTAFGDYMQYKLDDRDNYYYKAVYLGCARSIDYLCSLPEWDGKNVVVTGGSQGGALAIVTTALHEKVSCLAAFYPALSDITGYLHGRAGGWPHLLNNRNLALNNTIEKLRTISYYDVVNFARLLTVPGFYSWGYNDNTCPPTSVFAAVNVISAPKTIAITPISGHWRFEETNQQSLDWIRKQLK